MLITIIIFIISLISLLIAANYLIRSAAHIANYYRLSHFLTGITLVALGTSLPEIMIAVYSSAAGAGDIGIGNAIGTNIANIGLVLGLTAMIKPLRIQSLQMNFEYPLLFLVMLLIYSMMLDGYFNIIDSCILLLILIGFITYLVLRAKNAMLAHPVSSYQKNHLSKKQFHLQILWMLLSLIILPISAWYLIFACTQLANALGVSHLLIGLTIVAIGSSLPELITSLIAVKKGHDDLAIGNILGANIFNLLAVMIFPGIIQPAAFSHAVLWRDIPVMFAATLLLLWISYRNQKTKKLQRWHGALLILFYICYLLALVISASR